ncbi:hypothetical protein DFQ28_009982 [Apophysomyces sp. BC1034]|nr:hypothetical protein DFQ28_009982 [Apophysomyces sp. BC1034]
MEYVDGGELFEKIRQERKLPEHVALLIDTTTKSIRLCDFGFSKKIRSHTEVLNTYCGSPFYAAPEMVTATPYMGPPVDMWSCGVILYAMLTGSLPFKGDNMAQLFRLISQARYVAPEGLSHQANDLIQQLLDKETNTRMTAQQCLDHSWLVHSDSMLHHSLITASLLELTSKNRTLDENHHEDDDDNIIQAPKKSRLRSFLMLFSKRSHQIAPETVETSTSSKKASKKQKKKKKKALDNKVIDRFRGFIKSAFQKRLT